MSNKRLRVKLKLVYFQNFDLIWFPISKLSGFNPFNQILLSIFDVSNAFYDSFLVNFETKMCQTV